MKIALLIDSIVRGGAERQALYTFQELRRRGIDIQLIYYYQSNLEFDIPAGESSHCKYLPKQGRPFKFLYQLSRYLRREHVEILHAFKDTPCFYGAIAARLSHIPIFVAGYRTQGLPTGKYRLALRLVNRLCTAWVVNSRAISQALMDGLGTAPERLFTVYNGIDSLNFQSPISPASAKEKLGIPPGHSVVTIIAVLRPEKNHPMFIRMAASVSRSRPNTVFLIAGCPVAGDNRTQPELQALAGQLGVASQIRFLGLRSDVPDILKATDVLVLTSHLEGMSNALLEAMAAGVPFVTTNYAGVDELVTDHVEGCIVPLDDHEEMAKKVLQLLSDDELRARMSAAGRAKVNEQFGIPAMGDNLLKVYHQLLQSAHTRARALTS